MDTKGTVTPFSSVFPAEEAEKASKRVMDTIVERQQQLQQLKGFIDDNVGLINLVQKLPEETHHNIMVPFGEAAFFPGRLIHTNEFMVLLGEGYYTERTSKQTVEILKRRGKTLENQVESLKAIMQDLNAEASFFDATAQESAEGFVEIREDFVEEDNSVSSTIAGNGMSDSTTILKVDDRKASEEDEEFNRIMSRLSEIQRAEEEAEKAEESDESELFNSYPYRSIPRVPADQSVKASEVPTVSKDWSSNGSHQTPNPSIVNKSPELPEKKQRAQAPISTSNMAFTGPIVERLHNIQLETPGQQTAARSSKPVSRFKMQKK